MEAGAGREAGEGVAVGPDGEDRADADGVDIVGVWVVFFVSGSL